MPALKRRSVTVFRNDVDTDSDGIVVGTCKSIKRRLCRYDNCEVTPSYGCDLGKPEYCKKHAPDGTKDVASKRCRHEGCELRPSYGDELWKPVYCKKHAPDGTTNVSSKRCLRKGCVRQTNYGYEFGKAAYCKKHAPEGTSDVRNKRCQHGGCEIQPCYGEKFGKARYCKKHAPEGASDIRNKRCLHNGCEVIPCYGYEFGKAVYCMRHAPQGTSNVRNKRCRNYYVCVSLASHGYGEHCLRCYIQEFPDAPRVRRFKQKENRVHDCIRANFPNVTLVHDRTVQDGCSRRRPDLLIDLGSHVVVIEVDENQHEQYDQGCENLRMMLIFTDVGKRRLVMIRFNPDNYVDSSGRKQPPSFKVHKTSGTWIVRDEDKWKERLAVLVDVVAKSMVSVPDKEVTLIRLYFDGACPTTGVTT